ncbi:putative serine/threonine-protein kinase-like isoform X3 [Leptotrombidium deliense]|uniref:non-specific serine/threonine protein kinase n=1 Tax=Leptotrombidium deliense TaxID=299467 RepID=A0A443SND7_9ACAR|nr:putative serine/threonine-protein kinase-like isoform X3 [Leptotrombidium deliense]
MSHSNLFKELSIPPIRERPVLSSISASLESKHLKRNAESHVSTPAISRFRSVIKFREYNVGHSAAERKASIIWDIPAPVLKRNIEKQQAVEKCDHSSRSDANNCTETDETRVKREPKTALNKNKSKNATNSENKKANTFEAVEKSEQCVTNNVVDENVTNNETVKKTTSATNKPQQSQINVDKLKNHVTTVPRLRFKKYSMDDFDILKVLGRGSFGKVFLVQLKSSETLLALKCLKKHSVIEDDDVESAMIERRMSTLGSQNPFICKLFCTFQTDSHLNFVMEYLCGGDLMFHVQKTGKFSDELTRSHGSISIFNNNRLFHRFYASEIVCALKFLHKKFIIYRCVIENLHKTKHLQSKHLDLKLDNILLDAFGHIRLVDFGMCQCRTYREECLPSNFCGTPHYMAPELPRVINLAQTKAKIIIA